MPTPDSLSPLFDEFPPTSTEEWEEKIREDLRGKSYEDLLVWDSLEGVRLNPYYRRDGQSGWAHVDPDADTPPLAGGSDLPANDWAVRQDLAHPDLDEALRLGDQALSRGATDLGIVTEVEGDTVRGLPLQSVDDVASLIASIDPTETPLHLSGGVSAAVLLAFLLQRAKERRLDPGQLRGSVHFDPLAVLASRPAASAERVFDLGADLAREAARLKQIRTWTVSGKPYHDAGGSMVQELASMLGALSESLDQFTERGVSLPTALQGLQFVVPVATSYFLEIAKLRALRLLVPPVVEAFCQTQDIDLSFTPEHVHIQTVTSQRTQTTYGPYVNLLRGTTEAMAAVQGGCDVLSVAPFDASFRSADDFSQRLARNTQLILRHEAHMDHVADPGAGSYYIEAATDQLAREAWSAFQKAEAAGGLLAQLRSGAVQSAIADVREQRLGEVRTRDRVLVGTNHYPDLSDSKREEIHTDDPPSGRPVRWSAQAVTLDKASLESLREAAADGATLGDLVHAIHQDGPSSSTPDGSSHPVSAAEIEPLPSLRLSEDLERLRLRTEQYAKAEGGAPTVFLAPLGSPALRSARANFARNFFGVAGFEVIENLRFETPTDAVAAAQEDGADLVVLCSSDAEYPDLAPSMREAMGAAALNALLVIAGNPDEIDGSPPSDGFVHLGSPLLGTLKEYQRKLGVSD